MAQFPLTGIPYSSRGLIAGGQICINLYAELNSKNPQASVPISYYPFPGTKSPPYAQAGLIDRETRCTYRTSIGTAYVVVGPNVYFLAANRAMVLVGIITDRQSQVYMADNGLCAVIVDGQSGWVVDLVTNDFSQIIDPSFYGADFVVFLDTFFVFNRPDTNQFYLSLSMTPFSLMSGTAIGTGSITAAGAGYVNGTYLTVPLTGGSGAGATANITVAGNVVTAVAIVNRAFGYLVGDVLSASNLDLGGAGAGFTWTVDSFALAFDPLDIAAKAGSADPIVGIATAHGELWLIGELTIEVWIGSGAADFFFQKQQGAYIDHGCGAQYSIAVMDIFIFFIMQDKQGKATIVLAGNYQTKEISTPAIVNMLSEMETFADAIGFCFQILDHAYYGITFPTANKTLLYDITTERWLEWNWMDSDGNLNRARANCCMFAYNTNLLGDWEKGLLWELDGATFTNGNPDDLLETLPIPRIITFAHLLDDGVRVRYDSFIANIQCGTADPALDPEVAATLLTVDLSWSDDRGKTFGNAVSQSLGLGGNYLVQPKWNRLGSARDRVFKLQWSAPVNTTLNGSFIETTKAKT